jgi:hypothetical protein
MAGRRIDDVLQRMSVALAAMRPDDQRRPFLATYARTTRAVGDAVDDARFEDPEWVDRWDVAFAELYLDALVADAQDGAVPSRPWRIAFGAGNELHPLQQVLLGINAHVNYDLPQALLAVISDADFDDPLIMARRRRDHERIDAVLASRVVADLLAAGNVLLRLAVAGFGVQLPPE